MTLTEPTQDWTTIDTVDELVALVGLPGERAANKGRTALLPVDREWLAATPFCVIATADADGSSFAQVAVAFLLPAGRSLTTVV